MKQRPVVVTVRARKELLRKKSDERATSEWAGSELRVHRYAANKAMA